MKYLFALCSILLLHTFSSCQTEGKGGTPEAVKTAFQTQYPGENDPDWKKDKNGNFEASFKQDGIHYRADYSPEGVWVETESSIDEDELPKPIREAIKADYKGVKIVEVEKVDHPTKGTFYDVEFKIEGKKKDVEYNAQGQVIG